MNMQVLTGDDTLKLNDRLITDLADGDVGALTFPNDIVTVKSGKNDNVLFALNASGKQAELTLRVTRGGGDDKFLNNLSIQLQNNFAGFVLITGELLKKLGDGKSNVQKDTYVMSGGVISRLVDGTSNADGNTDQGVAIYRLRFGKAVRMIQ